MDTGSLLLFAPKIALFVLVLLGLLIGFEIKSIVSSRKRNRLIQKPDIQPTETVTKVHFPDTGVHVSAPAAPAQTSRFSYMPFFIVPLIVVGLFILVHLISSRQSQAPNETTIVSPTASPTSAPSRILVYKLDDSGELVIITYDDLKRLQPGTEIMIAVSNSTAASSAQFLVNTDMLTATERNSNGELFVRYTLQPGVSNYNIAVSVQ